jgi:HEAT repeat protein
MSEITAKQIEHIAAWQGRVNAALDQIASIYPRDQSTGIDTMVDFCRRFKFDSLVSITLFEDRRELFEDRLIELAERGNKFVASAAMRLLVKIGSSRGYETSKLYLDCDNPHLLEGAIGLFGLSAKNEELTQLEKFLQHPNPRLREASVKVLSQRGHKGALPVFLEMLDDLRCHVRENFGRENIRGSQVRTLLGAIVGAQGEEAIPLLVEIATKDVSMRTYAIDSLLDINPLSAAPAVAHLLADRSASLVNAVLRLVVKADYRLALPLIRSLLGNSDGTVRFHALHALIDWNDTESAKAISLMAKQEAAPVLRCLAVDGLVKLKPAGCENDIALLLGDLNVQVRVAAVKGLASLRELSSDTRLALEHLAIHDESEQVRSLALPACDHESRVTQITKSDLLDDAPPVLLIPPQLVQSSTDMLAYLRDWRESLPQLAGTCPIQQMNDLDKSLGILIHALEAFE